MGYRCVVEKARQKAEQVERRVNRRIAKFTTKKDEKVPLAV
jgi:hypothetical protein